MTSVLGLAGGWSERLVLLPANPTIVREWWLTAIVLGVIVAIVTGPMFSAGRTEYGLGILLVNLVVIFASLLPFIFVDYPRNPHTAAGLARLAYILFHVGLGALVGGATAWWLRSFQQASAA